MATEIVPGVVPEVGVSVIQLAGVLAFQARPATGLVKLISWLDDPPAMSDKLTLAGEAVIEGARADTFRIRLLPLSATKRFPEASTATPLGPFNSAEVAGPPSPEKPLLPLPATVVMMPLADTFRMF